MKKQQTDIRKVFHASYMRFARRYRVFKDGRRLTGSMSECLHRIKPRGTGKLVCLADDGTELGWFEFEGGTLVRRGPSRWSHELEV